jgi:hypothetical protein
MDQDTARLGHGLDDQNAGHHRTGREMPRKERFIDRDILDRCERFAFAVIQYPVNEQEWIAMRQHLHHLVDVYTIVQIFLPRKSQIDILLSPLCYGST